MPRKNYHALLVPNQVYHIYNHAVGKENLFKQARNYGYFWQLWNKFISPYFANYAFCLMPNHFHVLCKTKPLTVAIKENIQKEVTKKAMAFLQEEIPANTFYESQFQRLFGTYAKAINKQEKNRYGSLFKAKFRRTLVTSQEDFCYFLQYLHHNPIHHDFATQFTDWEYSSYSAYVAEKEIVGLSTVPVLRCFRTVTDPSGLTGFQQAHENFKIDFRKGD